MDTRGGARSFYEEKRGGARGFTSTKRDLDDFNLVEDEMPFEEVGTFALEEVKLTKVCTYRFWSDMIRCSAISGILVVYRDSKLYLLLLIGWCVVG